MMQRMAQRMVAWPGTVRTNFVNQLWGSASSTNPDIGAFLLVGPPFSYPETQLMVAPPPILTMMPLLLTDSSSSL